MLLLLLLMQFKFSTGDVFQNAKDKIKSFLTFDEEAVELREGAGAFAKEKSLTELKKNYKRRT